MPTRPCVTRKNHADDYKRHLTTRTIRLGLLARAPLVSLVTATLPALESGPQLAKLAVTTEQPLLLTFKCEDQCRHRNKEKWTQALVSAFLATQSSSS